MEKPIFVFSILTPSLDVLRGIFGDIFSLHRKETDGGDWSDDVNGFVQALQNDMYRSNLRLRVPDEVARGFEFYIADVMLRGSWMHPGWKKHRVVVLRGNRTPKGLNSAFNMEFRRRTKRFFMGKCFRSCPRQHSFQGPMSDRPVRCIDRLPRTHRYPELSPATTFNGDKEKQP